MAIDAAIAAVSVLLTKVFGFVVDPEGLAAMKLEHQIEVIHAGIRIAADNEDDVTTDTLFQLFRELSKRTGI